MGENWIAERTYWWGYTLHPTPCWKSFLSWELVRWLVEASVLNLRRHGSSRAHQVRFLLKSIPTFSLRVGIRYFPCIFFITILNFRPPPPAYSIPRETSSWGRVIKKKVQFYISLPQAFFGSKWCNDTVKKFSTQKKIFNRSRTHYFSQKFGLKKGKVRKKSEN